jgi:Ser/Thr protein kinase RdoA (MazF antagonist)
VLNASIPVSSIDLKAIAEVFHGAGAVLSVDPLGSGNVNDTYLVRSTEGTSVLQRINSQVFREPERVIANLEVLGRHVQARLNAPGPAHGLLQQRRWELPMLIPSSDGEKTSHRCEGGHVWRCITHVADAISVDVIEHVGQARELGVGLGVFHLLISDLAVTELTDTLEGFHITPGYLQAYHRALVHTRIRPSASTERCMQFIRERESVVDVLEQAKARGEIPLRPIHGDPKINNLMLDRHSGKAVALIDLDTVKPGLVHYDLGDCLRSGCNPLGEETTDLEAVVFDLTLAEAILEGYFSVAGSMLTEAELRLIPDAARLISFELGLRFFSDYLNGSTYFKANHPDHNLDRALVQFQLTASIEAQWQPLRAIVERLSRSASTALQQ